MMHTKNMVTEDNVAKQMLRKQENLLSSNTLMTDIERKSVTGGLATVSSQLVRTILQIVSTAILGRILLPEDFGLIAMVMAITNFAVLFGELGLSTATIQKEHISQEEISGLFWVNSLVGLFITLSLMAISPLIANFYGDSRLVNITICLGITFLFSGSSVQHRALLSRNIRFVTISMVEIISAVLSVVAGIISAAYGLGYWSLIVMNAANPIIATIAFWIITPWKPSPPGKLSSITEMLSFGSHVTINNIINYFSRNADNVLIGKFLGSAMLGYYSRAYNLMMMPIRQIRTPLIHVGMPALSRLIDTPNKYSQYYISLTTIIAFFSAPFALFLGVYAKEVIFILLGPGWEKAADVFQILAIAGVIQPIVGTNGMVMLSSGNSRRYMRMGMIMGFLTVLSFIIGLPWGITGVAYVYTLLNVITAIPQLLYSFHYTPIKLRDFLKEISYPIIVATIAIFSINWLLSSFFILVPIVTVLIGFIISFLLYIGLFQLFHRSRLQFQMIWKGFLRLVLKKEV